MTIQDTIKQLNILISRERYLLGCSSDEHQPSKMIEALEVAKEAVKMSDFKHGEWESYGYKWKCSVCQVKINLDGTPFENGLNYCPNCGAKMDVE